MWLDSIDRLVEKGVQRFVCLGPGRACASLLSKELAYRDKLRVKSGLEPADYEVWSIASVDDVSPLRCLCCTLITDTLTTTDRPTWHHSQPSFDQGGSCATFRTRRDRQRHGSLAAPLGFLLHQSHVPNTLVTLALSTCINILSLALHNLESQCPLLAIHLLLLACVRHQLVHSSRRAGWLPAWPLRGSGLSRRRSGCESPWPACPPRRSSLECRA